MRLLLLLLVVCTVTYCRIISQKRHVPRYDNAQYEYQPDQAEIDRAHEERRRQWEEEYRVWRERQQRIRDDDKRAIAERDRQILEREAAMKERGRMSRSCGRRIGDPPYPLVSPPEQPPVIPRRGCRNRVRTPHPEDPANLQNLQNPYPRRRGCTSRLSTPHDAVTDQQVLDYATRKGCRYDEARAELERLNGAPQDYSSYNNGQNGRPNGGWKVPRDLSNARLSDQERRELLDAFERMDDQYNNDVSRRRSPNQHNYEWSHAQNAAEDQIRAHQEAERQRQYDEQWRVEERKREQERLAHEEQRRQYEQQRARELAERKEQQRIVDEKYQRELRAHEELQRAHQRALEERRAADAAAELAQQQYNNYYPNEVQQPIDPYHHQQEYDRAQQAQREAAEAEKRRREWFDRDDADRAKAQRLYEEELKRNRANEQTGFDYERRRAEQERERQLRGEEQRRSYYFPPSVPGRVEYPHLEYSKAKGWITIHNPTERMQFEEDEAAALQRERQEKIHRLHQEEIDRVNSGRPVDEGGWPLVDLPLIPEEGQEHNNQIVDDKERKELQKEIDEESKTEGDLIASKQEEPDEPEPKKEPESVEKPKEEEPEPAEKSKEKPEPVEEPEKPEVKEEPKEEPEKAPEEPKEEPEKATEKPKEKPDEGVQLPADPEEEEKEEKETKETKGEEIKVEEAEKQPEGALVDIPHNPAPTNETKVAEKAYQLPADDEEDEEVNEDQKTFF